ncbi:MAG: hypothetical protein AAGK21_17140, partial [Bacteroidota bacterium]
MSRLALLLALSTVLLASAASGQARLVLREAVLPNQETARDTTGWEAATLDGDPIRLGNVLLPLRLGDVRGVSASVDPNVSQPAVALELNRRARLRFAAITKQRIGEAIALVLDGRVLMAPTVQTQIPDGRLQITGGFTLAEAEDLAS